MRCDAKLLLDSLTTAVVLTDNQLKICFANPAAEQMLEYSASKLKGHFLFELIDPAQHDVLSRLQTAGSPGFQGFSSSSVHLCPHPGMSLNVNFSFNQYTGDKSGFVAEMKNADYQQRLNSEEQRKKERTAAIALVRNLAHEIKNPLGGIRGAAQLLEMTFGRKADIYEYTQVIIEQADRLKNLVDSLLGPQRPNPMVLGNIHYVIEKVLSLEQMETRGNVQFIKDYDPSLPEIMLDIDGMQQALINIISNAVQIMHEAKTKHPVIRIKTRAVNGVLVNGVKYPTSISIAINDNGPGIPEKIRQTIFFPMVSARAHGHGLGLSIAQSIVERHSGHIECTSEPGDTTFRILIPLGANIKE